MKQGRASSSGPASHKTEPKSRAVNPGYASRLGSMQGNHAMDKGTVPIKHIPMYGGRGFKAPTGGSQVHKSGSQRRR